MEGEELLTPQEVARRLRVSPSVVRNWLRGGQLRGLHVGRQWRIREADLAEYLQRDMPRHGER